MATRHRDDAQVRRVGARARGARDSATCLWEAARGLRPVVGTAIKDRTMVLSASPFAPSGGGVLTIASTCFEVGLVPSGVGMCPRYSMINLKM